MSDAPPTKAEVEQTVEDGVDGDAEADVVSREAGVRLRTNIQAGGASERVNVTAEVHARSMADLVVDLPSYREVLGEQTEWAQRKASEVNE